MNPPRAFEIGLALDGSVMVITWAEPDKNGKLRSATTPCDGTSESIIPSMAELARRAPPASSVVVTLCRPLAQCRIVPLPRMSRATAESVLARDWARHIIGIRATPHDVSAREVTRGRWSVAFAPSDVLDAITVGAEEQGWRSLEIRSSDDALASVASTAPSQSSVVVCDDRTPVDAVFVRNGHSILGRRFLYGASDADVFAFIDTAESESAAAQDGATVTVLGDGARATALARALGARGRSTQVADLDLPAGSSAMASIAAAGMLHPTRLPLAAVATRTRIAATMRRRTWQLAFATAVALVAAFVLTRWETSRRLGDVQRNRAEISAQVRKALETRTAMEGAADVATALAEREQSSSRASAAAAAIAVALPRTASLTVLSIAGDSVLVEGESPQSADVYAALRRVPVLERIQAAAPLRQERQADTVVERFAFSARLRASAITRGAAP